MTDTCPVIFHCEDGPVQLVKFQKMVVVRPSRISLVLSLIVFTVILTIRQKGTTLESMVENLPNVSIALPNKRANPTSSPTQASNIENDATYNFETCCYSSSLQTLDNRFTKQFFNEQQKLKSPLPFTGREYEEWQLIRSKIVNHGNFSESCYAQFLFRMLSVRKGFYLRSIFNDLQDGDSIDLGNHYVYTSLQVSKPRVMLLGDSISHNIAFKTRSVAAKRGLNLSVQIPLDNSGGFSGYKEPFLSLYLGDCKLDLVQFNVGMHYHSSNMTEYTQMSSSQL